MLLLRHKFCTADEDSEPPETNQASVQNTGLWNRRSLIPKK
jgi:hypothetical protein